MKRRGFHSNTSSSRAAKLAALGKKMHANAGDQSGEVQKKPPTESRSKVELELPPGSPAVTSADLDQGGVKNNSSPASTSKNVELELPPGPGTAVTDGVELCNFSMPRATSVQAGPLPTLQEVAGLPEACGEAVIPFSPCPSDPAHEEMEFEQFSNMLDSIQESVASTPRKAKSDTARTIAESESVPVVARKPALGALSFLQCYDSDSQQSWIFEEGNGPKTDAASEHDSFNMSQLSESLEHGTDAGGPKVDYFNMSQLSESLDSSLHSGFDVPVSAEVPFKAALVSTESSSHGIYDGDERLISVDQTENDTSVINKTPPMTSLDEPFHHNKDLKTKTSILGAQISTSDQSNGDSRTENESSSSQAEGSEGSVAPHSTTEDQTADLNSSVLNETLPTSCFENNSFSGAGASTSHSSSDETSEDFTSNTSSSSSSLDQLGSSGSDTSILAKTLLSTDLNSNEVFNAEKNDNRSNSGDRSAVRSLVFLDDNDLELQDEILSAIDLTAEDTLVLPLDNDQGTPDDEIAVDATEAEGVLIEVVDVPPVVDPATKPRRSNPAKWKRNVVKEQSDSGTAHISLRGKQREERKMGPGCNEKCSKKCHQNFSDAHRRVIFKKFWDIKNHTMQWYYIAGLVKSVDIKRRTVIVYPEEPRRKFNYDYHLPSECGPELHVCQKFFLETLGINQKWVRSAVMKMRANQGAVPVDRRGKNKKLSPAKAAIKRGIIEHIKSFPTVEGHYTRKDSKSKYLPENLNKRIMYSMYKVEKQAANESYGSLRLYRDIFKSEFNLKFFRPKKDQCARCLSWKNKTPQEKTEEGLIKFEKHLSDKEKSNELKRLDVERVKTDEEARKRTCVLSCDLQKVLQCPKGANRDFFFASKLSIYNFTLFVSGEQQGINYVWDQTEANRGASEITSCLYNFISQRVASGITEFIVYSDNCSSQNKNQYLFSMYAMVSMKFKIKITHRYLEVGHTHMEVDSVHARIENSVKHTEIFVPNQWYAAIRVAKKNRPHYQVNELGQDMIFDFGDVAKHQTWDKLKTSTFREIVVDSEKPGKVMYKTSFDQVQPFEADIIKKVRGRPVNWETLQLKKKYSAKIPVPNLTLTSLQKLCKSGAIPSVYAPYYMEVLPQFQQETPVAQPPPEVLSEWEDSEESGSDDNDSERDEDFVL